MGRQWLHATLLAGTTATLVEAALLQVRNAYFTGGFLSYDYVRTTPQAIGFAAGSLLADCSVLAAPVALALWLGHRLGLRRFRVPLAAAAALVPIGVADLVTYQLQSFLGDAFDLDLMFRLVGGSPGEILAVSSAQLLPILGLAAAIAVLVVLAWWVSRDRRRTPRGPEQTFSTPSLGVAGGLCAALVVLGAVGCAALRLGSEVLDNGLKRKPSGRLLAALVNVVSDVDRDGYGLLGVFQDPAVFDARVYPTAVDIPGNVIDEDGIADDLPAGPLYVEPDGGPPHWSRRQSVVMIGLESFRADAFGARVDGVAVTPVLDALAVSGVSAPVAYSHNGYTVQSRRHVFTGSVADIAEGTLLGDFKANGYDTAYISGQDESFGGPAGDVGFDTVDTHYDARSEPHRRYTTFSTPGSLAVPHTVVVERVKTLLGSRRSERPLFLYVNFHDTHFPYHHADIAPLVPAPVLLESAIIPANASGLARMYRNTAANVDRAIGRVLDAARQALGADVGVIVLADHGESLFEEGFLGHGYTLNDAQTRIPLVVANLGADIPQPFGQSDLRGIVRHALAQANPVAPRLLSDPARRVFQYLGTVDQPAQIAFVSAKSRVAYDLRTRRVRFDAGEWQPEPALDDEGRAQFRDLVHTWERMKLARAGRPKS